MRIGGGETKKPGNFLLPGCSLHQKRLRQSLPLTRPSGEDGPESARSAGPKEHADTELAARPEPRHPAFRPSLSAFPSAPNLPVHSVPPLRRSREAESGGARGIISDLAGAPSNAPARLPRTRFTDATLARRSFHLTPRVNRGYSCPSAGLLKSPGAPELRANVNGKPERRGTRRQRENESPGGR